ncbi:putative 3-oxoacyl-[acyl-carrier-protein] synthase [Gordonia effusa NBRC 100432]|uniref:Putative 3-oxoacyl-[acyl-carrier-protein] synthase n=1 Tax=Gordonia effusa NBRC 100432 TaxID=1077974 RepID=H0R0L8_9ACTN|nr:3-oxoacyl-[acyl-carrier-protein] synthase III C-terminal domain-containing protein [Gordonia effusa]GAB18619.1 putative 3-oxoacyl-[acyl-carrier-protein] synthase [Gordonia effusa NBRC 100432]
MTVVSLTDVASYLPENRVGAEYFAQFAESDELANSVMFKAPAYRHHIGEDETVTDMIERAVEPLLARHGSEMLSQVDVLITHTQLPELPIHGAGGQVAHRLGIAPEWVIDLHNGGCVAFVYMMKLAKQILETTSARSALICTAQNSAGQVFTQEQVRGLAQAAIPGDGCGVGYLTKSDESPILATVCRHLPEYAGDMIGVADPPRKYWEAGSGQLHVGFTESRIAKVVGRGNRLVPEVASEVCERIGVASSDLDLLVTNQPNRMFLRNWREALLLPEDRHPDTFDECGNLFGAGIPVTFDHVLTTGSVKPGSLVMFAGFAHSGDFAGAAAFRWGGAGR